MSACVWQGRRDRVAQNRRVQRIRQGSYLQAMAVDSADYPEKEFIEGGWEFLELSEGGRAKLEAYLPNASSRRI